MDFCVLALLRDAPRYGFDLVHSLEAANGRLTSEGTIYPCSRGCAPTAWSTAGGPSPLPGHPAATTG